ncbi:FecR family protein [Asticcacaulis sp. 201]|uniref:FecR family protein n=1 Tax=Asticcacaulis sp. 201 TaxID=3028787 RepID=UPI002916D2A2|nr:FecR domain-containing protein [Asticcacaulis sp. 201]MDV6330405.1 FecR domain-containing protein [Asticcacaulis sp. 201]
MVRNLINFPSRPPADSETFVADLETSGSPTPKDDEMADVWDAIGLLDIEDVRADTAAPQMSRRWAMGGLLAAGLTGAAIGTALWTQRPLTYSTPVGGQLTVALNDGSRVTLNTGSNLEVRFHGRKREIQLVSGEAYFEVAHRADRDPFYVTAGAARIRVTGTRFAVQLHLDRRIDIDLLEGHIRTGKRGDHAVEDAGVRSLSAGQALRLDSQGQVLAQIPAESLRVENWLNQRAYFHDTPLVDAVAEMNRYRTTPLVVDNATSARVRVNGVFDTHNSGDFVAAVHALYGIRLRERMPSV